MDSFSRDPFDRFGVPTSGVGIGSDPAHQRNRSRDSLFVLARMTVAGAATSAEVRVRNLSETGLMAEVARPLANGTLAEFDIRGIGPVSGTVVWYAEGRIGVALNEPINPKLARKPVSRRARD